MTLASERTQNDRHSSTGSRAGRLLQLAMLCVGCGCVGYFLFAVWPQFALIAFVIAPILVAVIARMIWITWKGDSVADATGVEQEQIHSVVGTSQSNPPDAYLASLRWLGTAAMVFVTTFLLTSMFTMAAFVVFATSAAPNDDRAQHSRRAESALKTALDWVPAMLIASGGFAVVTATYQLVRERPQ